MIKTFGIGVQAKFGELSLIKLQFEKDFNADNDSKIVISIDDTLEKKNYFWQSRYTLHFIEHQLNKRQRGLYYFKLEPQIPTENKIITMIIEGNKKEELISNIQIDLFRSK